MLSLYLLFVLMFVFFMLLVHLCVCLSHMRYFFSFFSPPLGARGWLWLAIVVLPGLPFLLIMILRKEATNQFWQCGSQIRMISAVVSPCAYNTF